VIKRRLIFRWENGKMKRGHDSHVLTSLLALMSVPISPDECVFGDAQKTNSIPSDKSQTPKLLTGFTDFSSREFSRFGKLNPFGMPEQILI